MMPATTSTAPITRANTCAGVLPCIGPPPSEFALSSYDLGGRITAPQGILTSHLDFNPVLCGLMTRLEAVSDPIRLRLVRHLEHSGEASQQDLAEAAKVHVNTVRPHLTA